MSDTKPTYSDLVRALEDAKEMIEDWSGYASEYFRDKHDLAGDLERIEQIIRSAKQEIK